MKLTKSRLRQVIAEELQHILAEEDTGETRVVSRAQLKRDAEANARAKGKDPLSAMDTQEVDMDAIIQQQIDSMADPAMYREEAKRLFDEFFYGLNAYGIERLTHDNEELDEIVSKLGGFQFPQLYRGDKQPSPIFVKVAQEFEKEGIGIVNNEDHFLDRVEEKVITLAKKGFADTGAGSEEDLERLGKQQAGERKEAAQGWAVSQVIKVLNDEQPDKYGPLPPLDKATTEEINQLVRDIPRAESELYQQAYDFYMKKTS